MSSAFVWFDNIGGEREATSAFLGRLFGWEVNNAGPMNFLQKEGADMPFAATHDAMEGVSGWVPYVQVDDLAVAAKDAVRAGATLVAENLQGPAGIATIVRDPGGAPIALWTPKREG